MNEKKAREFMRGYYWNHDALRKDVKRLESAVKNHTEWTDEDRKRVLKWFKLHRDMIVHHHKAEDNFFFPKMKEKLDVKESFFNVMDSDHHHIDEWMDILTNAIKKNSDDLPELVARYKKETIHHLDEEERVFVPAVMNAYDEKEFKKMEDDYLKSRSKRSLIPSIPWAIDAMDKENERIFLKQLPLPVRILYKLKLKKDYEKLTAI